MTDLSPAALQAMLSAETDEMFLACVTFTHADMIQPIRVVNDKQDLVRNAGTFQAFAFDIDLPGEGGTGAREVQIKIDNVDRQIVQALRSLAGPPQVTLEVVLASSPNTLESGPHNFRLKSAHYDALVVTGSLGFESDLLNQPYPAATFTPTNSPGLPA